MILIPPLPGVTTTKPGSATKPFGVEAGVVDDSGNEVDPRRRRLPRVEAAMAGDAARIWGRCSLPGDVLGAVPGDVLRDGGARIDEDGDFWLLGRVDVIMNVSGHRISTIEVESALVDHPSVAEAAVCGRNDALTGQAIVAFVTLKGGRRVRSKGSRSSETTSP